MCNNDNYVPLGQEGYNPVHKPGTIYSVVTGNFSDVWKPSKNIRIDEGVIPFRGKVHFKVYNPDKPDKCGVKSYQLCDSSNGYCCRFEIYTGVNQEPPSAKGKTYNLVMRLMDGGLFLLQVTHHEMVEESVLPSVFLQHPEWLHPEQAKNPVTCAAKDLSKGACEGAC